MSCLALQARNVAQASRRAVSGLKLWAEAGREACIPPRCPCPRSFLLWTWLLLLLTFASLACGLASSDVTSSERPFCSCLPVPPALLTVT